jgi:hypothetical protein
MTILASKLLGSSAALKLSLLQSFVPGLVARRHVGYIMDK